MASYLKCYKSRKKKTGKTVIQYGALHVDETVMQNKKLKYFPANSTGTKGMHLCNNSDTLEKQSLKLTTT
jgi:hypothetical protein